MRFPKTPFAMIAIATLTTLVAGEAHADLARTACFDQEAILAHGVLEADAIVVGQIQELAETNGAAEDEPVGMWSYEWEARVRITRVLKGEYPTGTEKFAGGCSGHARMSRNHCTNPPGGRGKQVVLFFAKDAHTGKLGLWQLRDGSDSFRPCPEPSKIELAKKKHPKLLAEVRKLSGLK